MKEKLKSMINIIHLSLFFLFFFFSKIRVFKMNYIIFFLIKKGQNDSKYDIHIYYPFFINIYIISYHKLLFFIVSSNY
jgi:hypothetical protein